MRDSIPTLLLLGLMVVSIVASALWAAPTDRELLSPAPMTAPPQVQAQASPRPTPSPLPSYGRDRTPAPRPGIP